MLHMVSYQFTDPLILDRKSDATNIVISIRSHIQHADLLPLVDTSFHVRLILFKFDLITIFKNSSILSLGIVLYCCIVSTLRELEPKVNFIMWYTLTHALLPRGL